MTRAIFLDISKAFEKVWLPGLIYKIKSSGISGDVLELIKNFLLNSFLSVVLNGQTSELQKINAGVPQGSILGPLFLLIYINDLSDGISSLVKLFVDDTHSFQLFKIRIIQYHSLTMILRKLVIGLIHGKCLLTQIPQNKHKKYFFQGNIQTRIILPYSPMIYQSPRLSFKNILGCILMKNSITILT